MKISFSILAFIFLVVSYLMYLAKEYLIMISALVLLLISVFIIFADELKKHFKKAKFGDNELEFNTKDKKEIANIAFDLLESNFPKLTTTAQLKVENRIKIWTKEFIEALNDSNLLYKESKVLYDPDFQFVFNKALEIVGRKNDDLLNEALILFLIERIKYHNINRPDLVSQLDETIIRDIQKLTENHYKLMCLVKLLEDIKIILKDVVDLKSFNIYVLGAIEKFLITDVRCYEDLKKTNFIHNGGNPKLMHPKIEDREAPICNKNGKLNRPPQIKENLWEYFSDIYPFIKNATNDEKKSIIENDVYKICDINFKILKMILLLPFANSLINKYGLKKMEELYMENN